MSKVGFTAETRRGLFGKSPLFGGRSSLWGMKKNPFRLIVMMSLVTSQEQRPPVRSRVTNKVLYVDVLNYVNSGTYFLL